ncbi:MAG: hypothetical protein ACPLVJ_01755, partial [Candidatus Bathyarchaeales archaeon]
MKEEDLRLIRQIAKETVYEVLDLEVWDAVFELVNAFEAGIVAFKRRMATEKGVTTPSWNPDKIKWEAVEGSKGSYQRYPAEDQKAEATEDYKNMLRDLKAHNGRLTRDGYF